MKRLVFLLLLLVSSNAADYNGECKYDWPLIPRPHSVSVTEFGAVGDGKTINTVAFQNAIFYLKSFADKGGAQLYVPAGRWLIGCINLTSHLTLFLEKDAIILGSQDYIHWDVVEPLPSYGQGLEVPGRRYRSLISGQNLTDVVITGNNGTIDGQVYSPPDSPYTSGIVPDSSEHVCIENSNISTGYDAVALKSGWDEYGIAFGRPTTNLHIRRVRLQSFSGSGVAFGSEMSGGISNILVEHLHVYNSLVGIELKTAIGRGGYMQDIFVSDVYMENVRQGIEATGQWNSHPDDEFDPDALPVVSDITFRDIVGVNISTAGNFLGIDEMPFTSICLSNVSFSINSDPSLSWLCANVLGSSINVSPEPCPQLLSSSSGASHDCFIFSRPSSRVSDL
ncbi:putative polygalacturonase [Sesamum angolense]|uniref:Polygalacturonase n=1 Tax=Sesamum angolense TaxID=2727404 RepID=A0AAE2C3R1_9LAMI|nr:putative polygalacturonase [Sesamum angolense]